MDHKRIKQSIINIVKHSSKNSFKTIVFMLKIIIPITFVVLLLQYLNFLQYITVLFEPLMTLFGLPGDAALVLITANVINIYGGLAVMASLSFTVKEVTILAVMILFSHSLIVECAIIKGLNVSIKKQVLLRLSSALLSGVILNLLIGDQYSDVAYSTLTTSTDIPTLSFTSIHTFFIWFNSLLKTYLITIFNTILTLTWIITSILLGLEVLKEFKILNIINKLLYPLIKPLGLSESATSSLVVGLFIGITYGAGAILVHYQEGKMSKKDVTLITSFLLLCHAIIEDIFLFIQLGAIPWIVITYKFSFTILIVYFYNILLTKQLNNQYINGKINSITNGSNNDYIQQNY